jgi:DNA repair photolyase
VPGSYSTTAAYPAPYYSFGGYYGYATPMMYEPGYNITERYVNVETNIYRLSDEKLVWSGRSETVDPSSATELTRQIAQEAALVLQQQKLIK